jgi:hypothetical protein
LFSLRAFSTLFSKAWRRSLPKVLLSVLTVKTVTTAPSGPRTFFVAYRSFDGATDRFGLSLPTLNSSRGGDPTAAFFRALRATVFFTVHDPRSENKFNTVKQLYKPLMAVFGSKRLGIE